MPTKSRIQVRNVITLPKGTVIIAGGGPVGLLVARILSFYRVKSVLFERNDTTTKWPKMDLTNARSMELFRKLGLADDLRRQGVPADIDQNVLVSTGLSMDEPITMWKLPGVDKFRKQIRENNDGSQPLEPWQRVSQAIFERWLKAICDGDPLIELHYGHKLMSASETSTGSRAHIIEVATRVETEWQADYIVGCDGASSKVRESLGISMDGGPVPVQVLLVHFKSRDLTRLHKQGRFWHIFTIGESGGFEGAAISQDEQDTWTTHLFVPLEAELDKIGSEEAVFRVLGGLHGSYPIEIDKILVRSVWRPSIAVARQYSSPNNSILLAGDAVHQNIPTGGYGMNMGIADAFNLGWKLAAVINNQADKDILSSYESERKPVAERSVAHSGGHFAVHNDLKELLRAVPDPHLIDQDTEEGRALRARVHQHYQTNDGENKDLGIEMGYRYRSPIVLIRDEDGPEPEWTARSYIPTSWPGGRPPHIFLSDGSALFDRLGSHWALVVTTQEEVGQGFITTAAANLSIPLMVVNIAHEERAARLYERNLVLIRPDNHVSWRSDKMDSLEAAESLLRTVTAKPGTENKKAENRGGSVLRAVAGEITPARMTALV